MLSKTDLKVKKLKLLKKTLTDKQRKEIESIDYNSSVVNGKIIIEKKLSYYEMIEACKDWKDIKNVLLDIYK